MDYSTQNASMERFIYYIRQAYQKYL